MSSQNSIVICWRTNTVSSTQVLYGLSKNNLNLTAQTTNSVTNHAVVLNSLMANTKYFYKIQDVGANYQSDTFYFYTAPINPKQKINILAMGDCGIIHPQQAKLKSALKHVIGAAYINCWLLLGDNAYNSGLDAEYTNNFFAPYQQDFYLQTSCLFPCIGNHDYANDLILAENKMVPYIDIFRLPSAGQLGGTPSGTEAYYSYNYGNVHFISIDSYGTEQSLHLYDTLSDQYVWLKNDLQQNTKLWTIVYFHHPPYTMGSHNSDLEGDLVLIREKVTPLLYKNKVDLVLNGHSHNYERTWLLKNYTGTESNFQKNIHTKDSSSARYNGTINSCPYKKDSLNNQGTVYAVCGSSGRTTFTQSTYPHDAMYNSNTEKAMAAYIEVEDNKLNAYFIGEDSLLYDNFTMYKNVDKVKNVNCINGQTYTLNASWQGDYVWNFNSAATRQNTYTAITPTILTVRDNFNCVTDTFKINLLVNSLKENNLEENIVFPNPVTNFEFYIKPKKPSDKIENIKLHSTDGKHIIIQAIITKAEELILQLPQLHEGVYIISYYRNDKFYSEKIIIR